MKRTITDPKLGKPGNDDFVVYAWGLVHASVCTSLPLDEATARLNRELPTGIDSQWDKHDGNFKDGESNPCQCPDSPAHKHYLFSC